MKKVIILLSLLFLLSCEKQENYIESKITSISVETGTIWYNVKNNSGYELNVEIIVNAESDKQITFKTDCLTIKPFETITNRFKYDNDVYFATIKTQYCK
jgi:hypothetical protein